MKRRVVITGLGAVTPLGNDIGSNWSAAIAGKCGIAAIRGFEGEDLPILVARQVKGFDPIAAGLSAADVRHYDIYCQYAVAAALEAMADSGLVSGENIAADRLGVYIGSGIGGLQTFVNQTKVYMEGGARRVSPLFIPMMIGNMASGNCAIRFDARGVNLSTVAACASSTNSVGEAYIAVRDGRADAIISGGAEAASQPLSVGGCANSRDVSTAEDPLMACLPFDARRKGFVMAEGAGVLVLEEYEHAKARGAHILAEICGYGNSCDAYNATAPRPDGSTQAAAIRMALDQAGYTSDDCLYINAHGTSTPLNDVAETKAFKLALGDDAYRAHISSTKSMTGHALGAAGAIEAVASVMALMEGIVPPTINLDSPDPECDLDYTPCKAVRADLSIAISDSLGFGGHNACIAFRKAE